MRPPVLVLSVLLTVSVHLVAPVRALANGGAYRLVDQDGVIQITNAPADPRFERMPGYSGTSLGLLRLPEGSARARWASDVREIAARYGVDPVLVESVIRVESAGNPWAVSRKGAQGLMQLMPQTAYSLGVRDAFDPRQNIDGGVRHLRYLLDRYPGNPHLALAAYNAGERAVEQYRGIPPFAETQQYVQKVLGMGGLPAGAGAPAAPLQMIYKWEDEEGTLTFSNVPPPSALKSRR